MSDTKFTPGPWEYDDSGYLTVDMDRCIMKGELCIALATWDGGMKPRDANARLIAAAPELLEALENALFVLEATGGGYDYVTSSVRRAIAKARGEING